MPKDRKPGEQICDKCVGKWALDQIKKMHDTLMEFTRRINSKDNPSGIGLTKDQVKSLVQYVIGAINKEGNGSYRYLIYDVLGGVAYADGMDMGLLDLNNALVELEDDDEPAGDTKTDGVPPSSG